MARKRSGKTKRTKARRGRKSKKTPVVIKEYNYQIGKIKNFDLDKQRVAMPPGKRKSKSGKTYIETRANRSDRRGGT